MDPRAALERVVYLLDRSLAPQPKVRAFLHAIDVVASLEPGELEELHRTGRLTELGGIGSSTGAVIANALEDRPCSYINELEIASAIPIGEGAEIQDALRGDCHTHSTWSDGGASIEAMAKAAAALGHDYMVLTDHSARLTIAHGLDAARLEAQLDEIEGLREALNPLQLLTGMEVDIFEDGTLDMDDEMLGRLDVVVASVHSKIAMPEEQMTQRMLRAVESPHVDVLGHCTGRKVMTPGNKGRRGSTFDAEKVFAACEQYGTAVEINCRPERQDPPDDLLELALDVGCLFAISSDAHAPGQLEWLPFGCDKAARQGIEPERIINTWAPESLRQWAASR